MKAQTYLAGALTSLALLHAPTADAQACREGDFGMVFPNPCLPAQPQPPVVSSGDEAAEAAGFIGEEDEIAPAPAPAPAPAAYDYTPALVKLNHAPMRTRQLGIRSQSLLIDGDALSTAGVFLRVPRAKFVWEIEGYAGGGAQGSSIAGASLSVLKYRQAKNPRSSWYWLAGAGVASGFLSGSNNGCIDGLCDSYFESSEAHLGIGADYRLGRVTLSSDIRAGAFIDGESLLSTNLGLAWDRAGRAGSRMSALSPYRPAYARLIAPRASRPATSRATNQSGRELGFRLISGEDGDSAGVGAYLRSHRGRSAFELSIDAMSASTDFAFSSLEGPSVADLTTGMGSLVRYLNPNGVVRLYGTAGLGLSASATLGTLGIAGQAGVGADMNLGQRYVLNVDARALILDAADASPLADALPIASVGLARRR